MSAAPSAQTQTQPQPPTPAAPLPIIVCRAMVRDLVRGLPDPSPDTSPANPTPTPAPQDTAPTPPGTPDARTERDHAAIAEVALLAPADPGEIRVAIRCVTADAWANEYLRRMNIHGDDTPTLLRLTAQATHMGRLANANRHLLLRLQSLRRRLAPAAATPDADEHAWERTHDGLMHAWEEQAQDLATPLPKAPPLPDPVRPSQRSAADAEWDRIVAKRRRMYEEAMQTDGEEPGWLTPAWRLTLGLPEPPPPTEAQIHRMRILNEADRYAVIHPLRSRVIRRLGNLPPGCGIDPPPPELLDAIRTGTGTNQLWADRMTPAQAKMNAGRDRDLLWRYEEEWANANNGGTTGDAPG